ncbi:MAG: hypothetical protein J6Y57_11700 [Lachnospiraceae bacterium]|nr:hypothetical protein [Lachnospiraceae bacterium]
MAVKITTEKMNDENMILSDMLRLGKRGGFYPADLTEEKIDPVLAAQGRDVVDSLSNELEGRLHNPKNFMVALVSFAMYAGMAAAHLYREDSQVFLEQSVMQVLLYKCDALAIDAYVTDLTDLASDPEYAAKFRDFLGLFQTRSLMLCCNKDPEKLNAESCRVAAHAMYLLGVLTQTGREESV